MDLSSSYLAKTKHFLYIEKVQLFYNKFGIRAVVINLALNLLSCLITTKNVCAHNNNNNNVSCLLWESLVWKEIMRIFPDLWVYFFNAIVNVIIFLYEKGP